MQTSANDNLGLLLFIFYTFCSEVSALHSELNVEILL